MMVCATTMLHSLHEAPQDCISPLWYGCKRCAQAYGSYRPRFKLDANVLRVPIVPGCDPRQAYGDLVGRGVRGIVLEVFGVGNMPDGDGHGWLPWLRSQRTKGLQVSACALCSCIARRTSRVPIHRHTPKRSL